MGLLPWPSFNCLTSGVGRELAPGQDGPQDTYTPQLTLLSLTTLQLVCVFLKTLTLVK